MKDRLISLSDGIIAIAATIMVLELALPSQLTFDSILDLSTTFFAYLVSFSLIYFSWRTHNNIFKKIENVDGHIFVMNGLWLVIATLIPFATKLKGSFPNSNLAAIIYVLLLIFWFISIQLLDWIVVKTDPKCQKDEISNTTPRLLVFVGSAAALVIAYFCPIYTPLILAMITFIMIIVVFIKNE